MTRQLYEIRLRGRLGLAARHAFAGLDIEMEPPSTLLTGELDQVALHEVLDRVRALGLELVEITRPPRPSQPGPPPAR